MRTFPWGRAVEKTKVMHLPCRTCSRCAWLLQHRCLLQLLLPPRSVQRHLMKMLMLQDRLQKAQERLLKHLTQSLILTLILSLPLLSP